MAKAPAFQFYAKEWLSSSRITMMTPEQEGAYIRLLAVCWESGDCSLPDDDGALAMLSRIGKKWSKGIGAALRSCLVPHPNKPGYLTNERLFIEYRKQLEWREKCAKGGSAKAQQNSKGSRRVAEGLQKGSTDLPPSKSQLDGCIAFASADCIKETPSESADAALVPVPESIPAPKPKPKKTKLEPTGEHHEAIRAFKARWDAKYAAEYPFQDKDFSAVKSILDSCGRSVEKFTEVVERYLADPDPFYHGHDLKTLQSKLPRWLTAKQIAAHGNTGQAKLDFAARMAADAFGGSP